MEDAVEARALHQADKNDHDDYDNNGADKVSVNKAYDSI